MARRSQNPFEKAVKEHEEFVSSTPVDATSLVYSLGKVFRSGEEQVRAETLGKVNFANRIAPFYAGALTLNNEGLVQPPLNDAQVAEVTNKLEVLSLFTEANGEAGQAGPTDTSQLETAGRK